MTTPLTALRLAARSLLGARGFTTTVVLTLGVGMTLCTTAMVVVSAYLLNDLPYPAAERLHWIRYAAPGQDQPRGMEKLDWASLGDVIEHTVAWHLDVFYTLGGEHVESLPGAWVTPGFVQGLGIQPAGQISESAVARGRLRAHRDAAEHDGGGRVGGPDDSVAAPAADGSTDRTAGLHARQCARRDSWLL